jgi:Beta-lactamase superfamily domain
LELATGVDLLIHDAQYTPAEYLTHVGWGHSALPQAIAFATKAGVKRLVPFHHDPAHADQLLDRLFDEISRAPKLPFKFTPGREGAAFELGKRQSHSQECTGIAGVWQASHDDMDASSDTCVNL